MNKSAKLRIFIFILLATACWIILPKLTYRGRNVTGVEATQQVTDIRKQHENSVGPVDKSGTAAPDLDYPRFAELKRDLQISGDDQKDIKKVLLQAEAVQKLCELRNPRAVELIMNALLDPKQQYLIKFISSSGKVFTSSHALMDGLSGCLEGIPEPLNIIYDDEDLPRFAVWWQANKSNLRFKSRL